MQRVTNRVCGLVFSAVLAAGLVQSVWCASEKQPFCVSGVYPHLAMTNNEDECGTGAVVPWAGSLWVVTYGPHCPVGSSDKLYQIRPDLTRVIRPESVGGSTLMRRPRMPTALRRCAKNAR